MQKLHFVAALQAATDETSIPLEVEAIEWAISQKHEISTAFERGSRLIDGRIVAGVELKEGGRNSKHALVFSHEDWNSMSLDQHHQVYQLIERIILGARRMTARRQNALDTVIMRSVRH